MPETPEAQKPTPEVKPTSSISGSLGEVPGWMKRVTGPYSSVRNLYAKLNTSSRGVLNKLSVREYFYVTVFFATLLYCFESQASVGYTVYLTLIVTAFFVVILEVSHFAKKYIVPRIAAILLQRRDPEKETRTQNSGNLKEEKKENPREADTHTPTKASSQTSGTV